MLTLYSSAILVTYAADQEQARDIVRQIAERFSPDEVRSILRMTARRQESSALNAPPTPDAYDRVGEHAVLARNANPSTGSASPTAMPGRPHNQASRTYLRSGQSSGRRTVASRAGMTIGLHPHPLR